MHNLNIGLLLQNIRRNKTLMILVGVAVLLVALIWISSNRTKDTSQESSLIVLQEKDFVEPYTPTLGEPDAHFTLVVVNEFTCNDCVAIVPVVKDLYRAYSSILRLAFRHFPTDNAQSLSAAKAAQAAHKQDAFWEYHDKLFENHQNLSDKALIEYARALGLDAAEFEDIMDSREVQEEINNDLEFAKRAQLEKAPAVFLNGRKIVFTTADSLKRQVENELQIYLARVNSASLDPTKEVVIEKGVPKSETPRIKSLRAQKNAVFVINYTNSGFNPKTAEVAVGQRVKWVNTTSNTITFNFTRNKSYPDLGDSITLEPGASKEFTAEIKDVIAYTEEITDNFGYVSAVFLPEDLEE